MRDDDVSAQQKAVQGWQGVPPFQCGGEPPGALRAGGATTGLFFGRDQR